MEHRRSRSNVLFNFLPDQTADLESDIWKVEKWESPKDISNQIDGQTLRERLVRQIHPWVRTGRDGRVAQGLQEGRGLKVFSVVPDNGVIAKHFPNVWRCTSCSAVYDRATARCRCGSGNLKQLPFVAFCRWCGAIREPRVPRCQQHGRARIQLPSTAAIGDITFDCPTCSQQIDPGTFRFNKCQCGERMEVSHHRMASVYVPRTITIVNPPSSKDIEYLRSIGGAEKALAWTLGGLEERTVMEQKPTEQELRSRYRGDDIEEEMIDSIIERQRARGKISDKRSINILAGNRPETTTESMLLAYATLQGRQKIDDLRRMAGGKEELKRRYEESYPRALREVGLSSINLIGNFPVLTGVFGFTRGEYTAGATTLIPFKSRRGEYIIYGDLADTEALFFKLDPHAVVAWLNRNGAELEPRSTETEAHEEILKKVRMTGPAVEHHSDGCGTMIFELVHSYAHKVMKTLSVYAGIEHTQLSEMLLPHHLGFFVYAVPKGNFVLGGLQAIFETDLDDMLTDMLLGDFRCPLDPQCWNDEAACMACLHVGEPSCSNFNRDLSRRRLFGAEGFLYTA